MSFSEAAKVAQRPVPYPLRRRFVWGVLPILVLFMISLAVVAIIGGRKLLTDFYMQQAHRDANAIVASVQRQAAGEFALVLASGGMSDADRARAVSVVGGIIDLATLDRKLSKLKLYDGDGIIRYSTKRDEIGRVERGPAINETLAMRRDRAFALETADGRVYELYAYLPAVEKTPAMVIEMYESALLLDEALRVFVVPAALVPLGMLLAAILLLTNLVWRAQRELDARAAAAAELQARIETLISSRAVAAARQVDGEGMKGKAMDVTLYYADVRDFTSYAESRPPAEVVAMLNRLLTIQVDAIHAAGGDVDKIIGDATLAVFYGPERATQAIACAQQVLNRIAGDAALPRRLGIGIHDGFVIAGAVGAPNRQDFTVIGDAVNVSSRLCALAGEGELVTDTRTLARAGQPDGFGDTAEVKVKGRTEPLRIRRWKAVDVAQMSGRG